MCYTAVLGTIAFPFFLKAQQVGFIQSYCFENDNSLAFHDILLQNDTLVIFGRARHPQTGQIGLYFAKMDTLGNILLETTHYDAQGDDYFFEIDTDMISCQDSGYAVVGVMFSRNYPIMIKLKHDGTLDFVGEYPDDTVFNIHHRNLIETHAGYMTVGAKQQMSDYVWDAFIMGIDKNGNKTWETSYGEPHIWDNFDDIDQISENRFIVSGSSSISSSQAQVLTDIWGIDRVFEIDTLGQITDEWAEEIEYVPSSAGIKKPQYTNDGNWFTIGVNNTPVEEEFLFYQPVITKRNEHFEPIATIPILDFTSTWNTLTDLTPALNQEWVTVGRYLHEISGPPTFYYDAGLIAKVNEAGDLLWTRTDTLFYDASGYSDHHLGGVVVLPSGSIIACGQVNSDNPAPGKSYGWLIKVDKDGCIEPGCNPTSSSTRLLDAAAFDVFPNPIQNQLNVTGEGNFDLELLDANGRLLQSSDNTAGSAVLNTAAYPAGSYYLRIKQGQRWALRKVVKQ